ncbi:hypothetical protein LUR56_40095 [Streptomyces sp. MT29]|nr:hypothetical protein [Streptomyces sp. MT29]
MEAEIGGNPYMSQLMKARRTLKDLEIDQHNEAAERIRRAEALAELRQEAQDTREGLQRREQALPRIREATDRFSMTLDGFPYGERSDAGKALHRQITTRLLAHDREGMSSWHVLGQFRGLDFGVRTERDEDGKLVAHVGFPDLRHSTFERTVDDLKKKGAGAGMITRLSNALDKAPALQDSDRAKVPELDEQIALLQSAHASTDLTPQMTHARTRANLLEEIVGRITNLDAKPEIDADELDKKIYKDKDKREEIARSRREERVPLQASVDQAVADLARWDEENPAPSTDDSVRLTDDEVRETLSRLRSESGNTTPDDPDDAPRADEASSTDAEASDSEEQPLPGRNAGGSGDEPPADTPPVPGSDDNEEADEPNSVRLSQEEVRSTLASIQPKVSPDESTDDTEPDEPLRYAWDKPELFVTLTMPSALVDFLLVPETVAMEDPDTRKALTEAKRGRNGSLRVTGPVDVHRALLAWAWTLEGGEGLESDPDEARAYKAYEKRIDGAAAELRRRRDEAEAGQANAPESGTPPISAPEAQPDAETDAPKPTDETSTADAVPDSDGQPDTVTLSQDEVAAQLDAIRPEGATAKAPSSMTNEEISDEMVGLMEREMRDGELSGPDRTRMAVLEAEEARRVGRSPKAEPRPKAPAEEPGGLFDIDEPVTPQANNAPDMDNPEDRPADAYGTPDMIADAEGRDTSTLRPPRMRNTADLTPGDRYTDADGRTHTVAEPPTRAGRGRIRVVTDDGEQRFYNADAEVRLLYPDEEIQDSDTDTTSGSDDEPIVDEPAPEGARHNDDVSERTDRMAALVERALNLAGGDALPEIRELAEAMDRAESSDDPDTEMRDVADRLDALAEMYELGGPRGQRAAELFRSAAQISRGEDDNGDRDESSRDDESSTPEAPNDGATDEDQRDDSNEGAAPDGAPDNDENDTDPAPQDEDEEEDRDRRRRRRRRNRSGGGNGGPGGGGPAGPGGVSLPRLPGSDEPTGSPADGGADTGRADGGDGSAGSGRTPARHDNVDSLRSAWRNGEGLTAGEDSPTRRAALAQAADREGLQLSPGRGLVTWPEPQQDGTNLWRFAQARNGTNLPGLSLATDDPEEARALAERFESLTGNDGQAFDWQQPWGPSSITQWRDSEGRNLQRALHDARDAFEQQRAAAAEPERVPGQASLPDDLTTIDDDTLVGAWSNDLSPEDQLRLMAEMDRRDDYTDQRIRDAVPDGPPADAEEAERRGRAMDEALGFAGSDVTRPRRTREDVLRAEFADFDEARYQAALTATNGYFFQRGQADSDIGERELFSGGTLAQFGRWKAYASEELQDWYDANGGRITFNQFKKQHRENDKQARDLYEEERRSDADADQQAAGPTDAQRPEVAPQPYDPAEPRFTDIEALRGHIRGGQLDVVPANQRSDTPTAEERAEIADAESTQLSAGGRLLIYGNEAGRDDGPYRDRQFNVALPGSMQPLFRRGFRTPEEAHQHANLIEGITDADGRPFPWDAPDVAERVRSFRTADGNRLFDEITERAYGLNNLYEPWNTDRGIALHHRTWSQQEEEWHAREEDAGYSVVVDPADLRPGDEISFPIATSRGQNTLPRDEYVGTVHATVTGDGEPFQYRSQFADFGNPQLYRFPAEGSWTNPYGDLADVTDAFPNLGVARRRPRPDDVSSSSDGRDAGPSQAATVQPETPGTTTPPVRSAPTPDTVAEPESPMNSALADEPQGEADPIGGHPAHWTRVEDLVPGDMVRMDGTTKKGRHTTRVGYVYTGPVRVEVTRNGRTEHMWRTYVAENPDGTGKRGTVYTPLNASAARAQTPEDVVPGSPTSGAQSTVQAGTLPDVIPTDRSGRGLFPGSTVTGVEGLRRRTGTITGATNSTVSVRWDNDDIADGLSPNTLTVTDGNRSDGWTPAGQRVTARHIVADADGTLLGPVDEVNGDRITITTAEGSITRSAGDLRVTGEIRDEAPDEHPVTALDGLAAADLKTGDVVVLDLDDTLVTVAVDGTSRDGDRITIDYADTTTGEMGQLDVDATAILLRAQGTTGTPELGPADAPDTADDLTVHEPPARIEPITGTTVDPELTPGDRDLIDDISDGPEDDEDAHQAATRISAELPVTPDQAAALAAQIRGVADPSTPEGRAALRAADHLDRAAGRMPPAELGRPRPSNAAHVAEDDTIALPDNHGNGVSVHRVRGVEDGPGGIRRLLLEDENGRTRRRTVHGAQPLWQLDEAQPDGAAAPGPDDTALVPAGPTAPAPSAPIARVRPGNLRTGDVIDAPVSRSGYQFNGHRRLTIISSPNRNGWWMQLTGVDDDGNVHDFGLHSGRDVNVYERNRPTPGLPPSGPPRDPNPAPQSDAERIVAGHPRAVAARIINEAINGTDPAGDIHALREQIAQRLTAEALRDARQAARQDARDALDAAGITGPQRAAALQALKRARQNAHTATVRAALRTINDLEPLPDETDEDLAARARDLLSLIPDQIANSSTPDPDGDADIARTVTGHADDAVNALLQDLQAAGVDPGDANQIARMLTQQMAGSRQATARRIARRASAASPQATPRPGLLAHIVAALIRLAKRLAELVKAGAQKIAEKWSSAQERLAKLRAFASRLVRRVRDWPETRRLSQLHRALDLPSPDSESLAARVSHWAGLMPEPGRFGQGQRRVTWWKPTTWAQLAAGRNPGRSDRIRWAPDRAADGGPGLTALRHVAALRAAGGDVDQEVTRRMSAALGDDFGGDPHGTLQRSDDYVALTERRLVSLQAARSASTLPGDPELEVEITAARAEVSAARREWAELRAQYAAAIPDAVADALAEIRDMGPEGNSGIVFGPDSAPDGERAVRAVQRLIPRSWFNTPAVRRLTVVDGDEGGYEPDGQRITVADLGDDGTGTAGHALAQHLAAHLDDLDAAQRAFWFTQTHTGRPGARRMRPSALSRLLARQQTQPDTGDTLARSVQSMFNGDWYLDDDLRRFLLGLLATR